VSSVVKKSPSIHHEGHEEHGDWVGKEWATTRRQPAREVQGLARRRGNTITAQGIALGKKEKERKPERLRDNPPGSDYQSGAGELHSVALGQQSGKGAEQESSVESCLFRQAQTSGSSAHLTPTKRGSALRKRSRQEKRQVQCSLVSAYQTVASAALRRVSALSVFSQLN